MLCTVLVAKEDNDSIPEESGIILPVAMSEQRRNSNE